MPLLFINLQKFGGNLYIRSGCSGIPLQYFIEVLGLFVENLGLFNIPLWLFNCNGILINSRGPLEAGSVGIKTSKNDVIFRCNTITEKDNVMDNFNADHISSEEADVLLNALNDYFSDKYENFKGKFYNYYE